MEPAVREQIDGALKWLWQSIVAAVFAGIVGMGVVLGAWCALGYLHWLMQ